MSKYQVVCSIVIYKCDITQLSLAIKSFLNTKLSIRLLIIDNSPYSIIKDSLPYDDRIEYIFNNSNLGYGKGNNIGIRKYLHETDYYLVLNPDVYFNPGVLEELISFMEAHNDVGLIMPKILYPNNETQFLPKLLPSPIRMAVRKIPIPLDIFLNFNSQYELRFYDGKEPVRVPITSGCFSLFRKQALMMIEGYDERFFMYFEDNDISRRVNQYFKTIYYPRVSIYHMYGRGAQKNVKLLVIFLISAFKYFNKWGWFFDKERRIINRDTLAQFKM
jgi:GT2 family glycosyltransferase